MTKGKTPRRRACDMCADVLGLLQEAVNAGMTFSEEERRVMLEKCQKSIEENTKILESRGYTQDAKGRWGYHKHPIH